MGKQRRTHILDQAGEISQLIHVPLGDIRVDTEGVLATPEQMDMLLSLARERAISAKQHVNA